VPLTGFFVETRSALNQWRLFMFKYEEINMNFEVTLYCAE